VNFTYIDICLILYLVLTSLVVLSWILMYPTGQLQNINRQITGRSELEWYDWLMALTWPIVVITSLCNIVYLIYAEMTKGKGEGE